MCAPPTSADQLALPDGPEIEIDLASGDGSFLLQRAESHPDRLFLGLDQDEQALQAAWHAAQQDELDNTLWAIARLPMQLHGLLEPESVRRAHLHFPPPALVSAELLRLTVDALEPQGELFVQLDTESAARRFTELLRDDGRLVPVGQQWGVQHNPFAAHSAAEQRALGQRRAIWRLLACRLDP